MSSRTWLTTPSFANSLVQTCTWSASSFCSGSSSGHDSLATAMVPASRLGARQKRGAQAGAIGIVALEVRGVELDRARSAPRWPRRSSTKSWPGPRRRRVSQPSPMSLPRPGKSRLCIEPKCWSLVAIAWPPFSNAASRGASRVGARPVGNHLAVGAQARHSAVGEDVQPQVGARPIRRARDPMVLVRLRAATPAPGSTTRAIGRRRSGAVPRFDRRRHRLVAVEERGVDVDAAHDARARTDARCRSRGRRRGAVASPTRPSTCRGRRRRLRARSGPRAGSTARDARRTRRTPTRPRRRAGAGGGPCSGPRTAERRGDRRTAPLAARVARRRRLATAAPRLAAQLPR